MGRKELRDLAISELVVAMVFGIAVSGGFYVLTKLQSFIRTLMIAFFSVSLGFILHELGYCYYTRRFGCNVFYKRRTMALGLALVYSLFGFVFTARGSVEIYPGRDESGYIYINKSRASIFALAGQAMNLLLAILFVILNYAFPTFILSQFFVISSNINTCLSIFNLISGPY